MTEQDIHDFCKAHLASHPKEVWDLFKAWNKIKNSPAPQSEPSDAPNEETFRVCLSEEVEGIQALDEICRILPGRDRWELLTQISTTGWVQGLTWVETYKLVDSGYFSWLPRGTLGRNSSGNTIWTWNGRGWFNHEGWPNNPCYPVHPILPWPHV